MTSPKRDAPLVSDSRWMWPYAEFKTVLVFFALVFWILLSILSVVPIVPWRFPGAVVFVGAIMYCKYLAPGGSCRCVPASVFRSAGSSSNTPAKLPFTDVRGAVAVVTGASSGIGLGAAGGLAALGMKVVLAVRNVKKGEETAKKLQEDFARVDGKALDLEVMEMEMSSLGSVRQFVDQLKHKLTQWQGAPNKINSVDLDGKLLILVNNAGYCPNSCEQSEDGIEAAIAANYLGHFLLTRLLLPELNKSQGRIVNISSAGHHFLPPLSSPEQLWVEKYSTQRDFFQQYCRTKLMQVMFTIELNERNTGRGATIYSLHPGAVGTSIWNNSPKFMQLLVNFFCSFAWKNIWQGSQTTLVCCLDPEVESGRYYADCQVFPTTSTAMDPKLRSWLWKFSSEKTGLPIDF